MQRILKFNIDIRWFILIVLFFFFHSVQAEVKHKSFLAPSSFFSEINSSNSISVNAIDSSLSPEQKAEKLIKQFSDALSIQSEDEKKEKIDLIKSKLFTLGDDISACMFPLLLRSEEEERLLSYEFFERFPDERILNIVFYYYLPTHTRLQHAWSKMVAALGEKAVVKLTSHIKDFGVTPYCCEAIRMANLIKFIPKLKEAIKNTTTLQRDSIALTLLAFNDPEGMEMVLSRLEEKRIWNYNNDFEEFLSKVSVILGMENHEPDMTVETSDATKKSLQLDQKCVVLLTNYVMSQIEQGIKINSTVLGFLSKIKTKAAAELLWKIYQKTKSYDALTALAQIGYFGFEFLKNADDADSDKVLELIGEFSEEYSLPWLLEKYEILYSKQEYSLYFDKLSDTIKKVSARNRNFIISELKKTPEKFGILFNFLDATKIEHSEDLIDLLELPFTSAQKLRIITVLSLLYRENSFDFELFFNQNPKFQNQAFKNQLFKILISLYSDSPSGPIGKKSILNLLPLCFETEAQFEEVLQLYQKDKSLDLLKLVGAYPSEKAQDLVVKYLIENPDAFYSLLSTLVNKCEKGLYKSYFSKTPKEAKELFKIINVHPLNSDMANLLINLGTDESIKYFIDFLKSEDIDEHHAKIILNALIESGKETFSILKSQHPGILDEIKTDFEKKLLEPIDYSQKDAKVMDERKDTIADLYKRWCEFCAEKTPYYKPAKTEENREMAALLDYYNQRTAITNLITDLKVYLKQNPDATMQNIYDQFKSRLESIDGKVSARFTTGLIRFIRDREKVKYVMDLARKTGIIASEFSPKGGFVQTKVLQKHEIETNDELQKFIVSLMGFVPDKIRIYFMEDSIHVQLNEMSYGRSYYRTTKNLSDEHSDSFSSLSSLDQMEYVNSNGFFSSNYSAYFDSIELGQIMCFEKVNETDFGIESSVFYGDYGTLVHEKQHSFFQRYAKDEINDELKLDEQKYLNIVLKINFSKGEEKLKVLQKLTDKLANFTLFDFQNELMSKIRDGFWNEMSEQQFLNWFEYYTNHYKENITRFIDKVVNDSILRQQIIQNVYLKAKQIMSDCRTPINGMFSAKVRQLESENYSPEEAKERAREWMATFLQTLPASRFSRLNQLWPFMNMHMLDISSPLSFATTRNRSLVNFISKLYKLSQKLEKNKNQKTTAYSEIKTKLEMLNVKLNAIIEYLNRHPGDSEFIKKFNEITKLDEMFIKNVDVGENQFDHDKMRNFVNYLTGKLSSNDLNVAFVDFKSPSFNSTQINLTGDLEEAA